MTRRAGQVQQLIRRMVGTVRDRPQRSRAATDGSGLSFLSQTAGGPGVFFFFFLRADLKSVSEIYRKKQFFFSLKTSTDKHR